MTVEHLPYSANPVHRTFASYERDLTRHRSTEVWLREALARKETQLRQKDELIQQNELMSKESDHRLLNGLQIIASLLSLQSRASTNTEAASQLAAAAKRMALIAGVHRHLHGLDGVQTVALKQYLENLCRDYSTMLSSGDQSEQSLVVEGTELKVPCSTGIPLGCIVSELITNAAKYGKGRISVSLEPGAANGFALSVSNDGPSLPEGFDPAAPHGLGMKIIQSLVKQIGGELRCGPSENNQGARFTVLCS
jgi:two-component system, sensor histidine kinase PdtaS